FGTAKLAAFGLTVGIGAIVIAFAGMTVAISNNKTAMMDLQTRFGSFGEYVTTIMETVGGVIKLTLGNLLIMLGGIGKGIGILLSDKSWDE
ncbi:TPA: hypothetical protein KRA21_003879, partial [Clostridioides difficile]|nr:hypothetical protein [Clostridioides difficile]